MRSDGKTFVLDADNRIEPFEAQNHLAEDWLQVLAQEHPEILAGGQISPEGPRKWLLFSGEKTTPRDQRNALWSLDYLILDQNGVPTLVQVKRRSDIKTRQELVGRTLAHAATLTDCWPAQQIRSRFEEDCAAIGDCPRSAVREFLGVAGDAAESSVDEFWQRVERNLRIKRLRLLFVADSIPAPLRRVVEFLNEVMYPTRVLAVEVLHFKGERVTAPAPRFICQAEARRRESPAGRRAWDEAMFLSAIRTQSTARQNVSVAVEELLAWSKLSGLELEFESASSGFRCSIRLPGANTLLRIETRDQSVSLVVTGLQEEPPFDSPAVRDLLNRMLEGIPGYSLKSEGTSLWPVMDLTRVVQENRLIDFVKVVDWMVEECELAATASLVIGPKYVN